MKVGINARILNTPSTRGWSRYAVNLLKELSGMGVELVLYSDRPLHPFHIDQLDNRFCRVIVSPPIRYLLWEQLWLPRRLCIDHIDVFHSPFNFGLPLKATCPLVLTLHDAIDQVFYAPQVPLLQKIRPRSLTSWLHLWTARTAASRIITVSEHARQDLIEHLHLPADKISVIYEAADPRFVPDLNHDECERVRAKYGLPERYIFYLGGWEVRKNVSLLLRAFAAADLANVSLLLAGGRAHEIEQFSRTAEELRIRDKTLLLGLVDDADLPALYKNALCFVYPSQYEGFGLQLCEAMATGCPVFASCSTALTEILAEGGERFNPNDPAPLANLLGRIACEAGYRDRLALRARARGQKFSWRRAALQTLEVYRAALAEHQ